MKKLNYLITLLLISTSIISCSNDDDSSIVQSTESDIIGTWELTDYSSENAKTTTEFLGQSTETPFEYQGSDFDYSITFNEDNTFVADGTYIVEVTSETLGQTSTQQIPTESNDDIGEWELDGNTLIFKGGDNADIDGEYEIIERSDSLLRLSLDFSDLNSFINQQEDFESIDGFEISLEGKIIITLER